MHGRCTMGFTLMHCELCGAAHFIWGSKSSFGAVSQHAPMTHGMCAGREAWREAEAGASE